MRDWLGKPMLIIAVILLVLAAFSIWYVRPGPSRAGAADEFRTPHQRQAEELIRRMERER